MNLPPVQRHQRLAEVFRQVCDSPSESREELLRSACGGDEELRRDVHRLLSHDSSALISPRDDAGERLQQLFAPTEPDSPPDIKGFRITGELGRGGMGVVYLAEQACPRREVALKVIRSSASSPGLIRRLMREADVLARLKHPGIASVLESGTFSSPRGGVQPFFVMDVVRGEPITNYVQTHGSSVHERLRLLAQVCDAVQHAHAKGVIHRDLKPANVLVTESGDPKVLDFGVARLIGAHEGDAKTQTNPGQLVGTVQYMSPEQATGDDAELDTRSDVYSLGLILYEMLAEVPAQNVENKPLFEALKVIREGRPRPLGNVARNLRGDTATVVAKALAKGVSERYQSALELGADLRRIIAQQPISARPPTLTYVLAKIIRRNRTLASFAGAAVILIMVSAVAIIWLWRTSVRGVARLSAEQRYVLGIFGGADRVAAEVPNSMKALLDRAVEGAHASLSDTPLAEADLLVAFGLGYASIGHYEAGAVQLEKAYRIRSEVVGPTSDESLDALEDWGRVQAEFVAAIDTERPRYLVRMEGLVRDRTVGSGEDHPKTLRALGVLAKAESLPRANRLAQAHAIFVDLLPKLQVVFGSDSKIVFSTMCDFVDTLSREGHYGQALTALEEVMKLQREKHGETSPEVIGAQMRRGVLIGEQRRSDASAQVLEEVVRLADGHLSEDHFLRWDAHHHLGRARTLVGQLQLAEPHLRMAFEMSHKQFYPRYNNTLTALVNCLDLQEKWSEAESLLQLFWREHVGSWERYPDYQGAYLATLSRFACEQGRLDEAELLLSRCEALYTVPPPQRQPDGSAWALYHLAQGRIAMKRGQSGVAEALLLRGFAELAYSSTLLPTNDRQFTLFPTTGRQTGHRIIGWLVELYQATGSIDEADRWQAVDRRWACREIEGRILIHSRQFDLAEQFLVPRLNEHRLHFGDTDLRTIDAARTLVELYEAWQKPEKAAPYRQYLTGVAASVEDDLLK